MKRHSWSGPRAVIAICLTALLAVLPGRAVAQTSGQQCSYDPKGGCGGHAACTLAGTAGAAATAIGISALASAYAAAVALAGGALQAAGVTSVGSIGTLCVTNFSKCSSVIENAIAGLAKAGGYIKDPANQKKFYAAAAEFGNQASAALKKIKCNLDYCASAVAACAPDAYPACVKAGLCVDGTPLQNQTCQAPNKPAGNLSDVALCAYKKQNNGRSDLLVACSGGRNYPQTQIMACTSSCMKDADTRLQSIRCTP